MPRTSYPMTGFVVVEHRLTVPVDWDAPDRFGTTELFARELAEARRLLEASPEIGTPFLARHPNIVRRVLLPKTKNHVYYIFDRIENIVIIVAVWGAPKGRGPKL